MAPGVFLEHLHQPSVKAKSEVAPATSDAEISAFVAIFAEKPDCTLPYLAYLIDQELPSDEVLARKIMRRASAYTIINDLLYKRSATGIF